MYEKIWCMCRVEGCVNIFYIIPKQESEWVSEWDKAVLLHEY